MRTVVVAEDEHGLWLVVLAIPFAVLLVASDEPIDAHGLAPPLHLHVTDVYGIAANLGN
jgi:hypothetical protein